MLSEVDHFSSPLSSEHRELKRVFLSLGSNVGDRRSKIRQAFEALNVAGIFVRRVSSFYRTEPVDFGPQPWFLNCVAEVMTRLMPMQLLKAVKSAERSVGRRPGISRGPRPIDIDILFYENAVVRTSALTIPHARLAERRFVLIPLRELAPSVRHPVLKRTVLEMLQETADLSQVIRFKSEG
jgi:2-amino-4-hydroxy-6-hydroxymethyldihydropteridine diphosphokinase